MKNISFDNPYLLLIAIPLLAVLLIPYFISVSKDNRSKGWIASLVIHTVIVVLVSLAAAGLVHTTVKTRTKVYVVADVSYSSNRNLDEIDAYIKQIEENLPQNSQMGIICFGKDTQLLTPAGTEIKSVKEAEVNDKGTDIAKAINEAVDLFGVDEIKRIVLITDGFNTVSNGNIASAIARAQNDNIKIDTIYLNNNLREGEKEVQISDVEYTKSTYLNHESKLNVLVESNSSAYLILDLYVKSEGDSEYKKITYKGIQADVGMNVLSFDLPTDQSGVFDYKVSVSSSADTSDHNNDYHFTQTVAGQRNVLLITGNSNDEAEIKKLYSGTAFVKSCVINSKNNSIPYTVEELVKYDEIILSNVDIRKIANIYAFVDSVDIVVSEYGKSLITLGNLYMQNYDPENSEDDVLARLEEILPVSFGNANKESKLYTIVLDISTSMYSAERFTTAKRASQKLLSILDDDDYVAFIAMSGNSQIIQLASRLGDVRGELYETIDAFVPLQGTYMGSALSTAYDYISGLPFAEKQVMLISDGLESSYDSNDSMEIAKKMYSDDIVLSTVNVMSSEGAAHLEKLATAGDGKYYFLKNTDGVSELVFKTILGDVTDSVVEKQTKVNIKSFSGGILDGIMTLPDVYGYLNSKAKFDATTVLTVDYQKNSTTTKEVPLYAYRGHGNGKVVSFTSSLSENWLSGWDDTLKGQFFGNMLVVNTPSEYVNYPFNISVEHENDKSVIEIIPSAINPKATASITLITPKGMVIDAEMTFSLNRYYVQLPTAEMGKYHIQISYVYGNHTFTADSYFTRNYGEEYDAFAAYDIVKIYDFMRGVGQIYTDGNVDLQNAKNEVDTYQVSFRIPLFIAAISLFLVDVIVRKFSLKDIKGLFVKTQRKESNDAVA